MKPFKSLVPFAKWLLRAAAGIIIFYTCFDTFLNFDFKSTTWLVASLLVIFTTLLIVGGFMKNNSLTVVSGMLLLISGVIMILLKDFNEKSIVTYIGPAVIGFYFMARGNNG